MNFIWWFCIIFNIGGIGYGLSNDLRSKGPVVRWTVFMLYYMVGALVIQALFKKFGITL